MSNRQDEARFKIGELVKRLGLSIIAVRYYETLGILPPPPRTPSGYRLYTEADERLLRFVLHAKQAGLTLEEIRRITQSGEHEGSREDVLESLQRRIRAIDAEIAELQQFRKALAATAALPPEVQGQQLARDLIERLASLPLPAPKSEPVPGISGRESPNE